MRPEEPARVLDLEVALYQRFEEVADRGDHCYAEADQECVGGLEPLVLVGDGEQPEGERAADYAGDQPLERLVRRDQRRQRPAAPRAAAEVGGRVLDERADQDIDDERATMVQAA